MKKHIQPEESNADLIYESDASESFKLKLCFKEWIADYDECIRAVKSEGAGKADFFLYEAFEQRTVTDFCFYEHHTGEILIPFFIHDN